MRKIVLTFGLVAGAVLSAMMVITFVFFRGIDFDTGAVVGYATMVLAFLMVWFGVRTYRDNIAEGRVTFGRAFKVGLLIMLVASCCYVATWEVIYYKFAPDFMAKYATHVLAKAKASGATDAQLAEQKRQMDALNASYRNPIVNIGYTFLEPLPVGLLFALGSAAVASRKRKPA